MVGLKNSRLDMQENSPGKRTQKYGGRKEEQASLCFEGYKKKKKAY